MNSMTSYNRLAPHKTRSRDDGTTAVGHFPPRCSARSTELFWVKKWGEKSGNVCVRWARAGEKKVAAAELDAGWCRKRRAHVLGRYMTRGRTDAGWADTQAECGLLGQVTSAFTFLLEEFVPNTHKCCMSLGGRAEAAMSERTSHKEAARPGRCARKQAACI